MTASVTAAHLVGAWLLQSWRIRIGDRSYLPFGPAPRGLLTYTADGWMQACLQAADRSALSDAVPSRAPIAELAAAFTSFFSYAGRYEVRGTDVVHHVEIALNPAMVGTDQIRRAQLSGVELVLSADEKSGGAVRRHELTWHRAP